MASKLENYILILNKYLDELCEYIDIIFDMRDVINDIPNKFYNDMTQDFFIVKNAINEKNDLLNKKYEEYNAFKNDLIELIKGHIRTIKNIPSDDISYLQDIETYFNNTLKTIEDKKINSIKKEFYSSINI